VEKFEKKFVFCYTLIEKKFDKKLLLKTIWLLGKFIMKLLQNRDIKLKLQRFIFIRF